jgi:predicted deacylase
MTDLTTLFPATYEESRARFRQNLERLRQRWPAACLKAHPLAGDEDLTIDWLEADAVEQPEHLLVVTTGEHGIETYVGAAMLQLLVDEYFDRLDPKTTGLLLVHAINPWGMKHRRRVNRNNIDLNRTFMWPADPGRPADPDRPADPAQPAGGQPGPFDPTFNADYGRLAFLLSPAGPLRSFTLAQAAFLLKTLWGGLRVGLRSLTAVPTLGQYAFPQGIYYGGQQLPEETGVLMALYRQSFQRYSHLVHFDMHTGYGPRDQMSVVTSELEPRASELMRQQFAYPLVVKANAAEFYALRGDMIDYVYTLWQRAFPERRLYSATCEFGTQGATLWNHFHDLRTMVFENWLYARGAANPEAEKHVRADFEALFAPGDLPWRQKAAADMRQAFEGIARTEGLWV